VLHRHLSLFFPSHSLFVYYSSSSITMSSFSFSALPKPVANPAEVQLRQEWDEICVRVKSAVASLPEDRKDNPLEQAQWLLVWGRVMVSVRNPCEGRSRLTSAERWQAEAQAAYIKGTELKIDLPFLGDTDEAETKYNIWTTRIRVNSQGRKSTKEPSEVSGDEDEQGDVVMAATEPGSSASAAVSKRRIHVKVSHTLSIAGRCSDALATRRSPRPRKSPMSSKTRRASCVRKGRERSSPRAWFQSEVGSARSAPLRSKPARSVSHSSSRSSLD
jgi:hypothetical protein